MKQKQIKAILAVLENIKTCIDNKDTYIPGVGDCHNKDNNYRSPFNLSLSFSIDWHVYAHTSGDLNIDIDILHPVYLELGYENALYPVESKLNPGADKKQLDSVYDNYDLYFRDNEYSKNRAILVEELIQYYKNKL